MLSCQIVDGRDAAPTTGAGKIVTIPVVSVTEYDPSALCSSCDGAPPRHWVPNAPLTGSHRFCPVFVNVSAYPVVSASVNAPSAPSASDFHGDEPDTTRFQPCVSDADGRFDGR